MASLFANEIMIGTNSYEKPFCVISLTDNQTIITAIGNDFGFHDTFVHQLKILANLGEILVGISAYGNCPNLIRTFEYAKSERINSVAITVFDGEN